MAQVKPRQANIWILLSLWLCIWPYATTLWQHRYWWVLTTMVCVWYSTLFSAYLSCLFHVCPIYVIKVESVSNYIPVSSSWGLDILPLFLRLISRFLQRYIFYESEVASLTSQPQTWRARVFLLVCLLPLDQSSLGDPASSHATAGIALGVQGAHKPSHHAKVGTPSRGYIPDW
jgi:hypothetical protein